jgi:F-type H+-transporting ATPase subunit b
MEETLRQLGQLLLGSVPTIVLFLILYAAYRTLVYAPLEKILSERQARTEGALERARADIAAAEARTAEYEQNLRQARAGIFQAQEARRRQAQQTRETAIAEARLQAGLQVKQAKTALAQEVAAAKGGLQADAERLASEIMTSILRPVGAARYPAGGGQ